MMDERYNLAHARASSYGFLAWLFLEKPESDFIARLQTADVQAGFRQMASGNAANIKMTSGLQEMLTFSAGNGSRSIKEIMPGPRSGAHPSVRAAPEDMIVLRLHTRVYTAHLMRAREIQFWRNWQRFIEKLRSSFRRDR